MSDDIEVDEFKARRRRLIDASKTPLTKVEIEENLKKHFKGKSIDLIVDDRTWTLSKDFEATISDPNNNKQRIRQDVTLATCGNLHGPLSDVMSGANWLLAQVNSVRAGGPGGRVVGKNG